MKVTELYIYPIKSLAGIAVQKAKAEVRGFQYDRRWMLVDQHGNFLTQRTYNQMALLQPAIKGQELMVSNRAKAIAPIKFPLFPSVQKRRISVTIWKDTVEAILLDNAVHHWFSQQLGTDCRLVYLPESSHRQINRAHAAEGENVSFADGYPYLLIGQSAIDLLNKKLKTPIAINRFRPNIVFSGLPAHAEDDFVHFKIGNTKFRGIKPCVRCQVPNINQETGLIEQEPNKTLATYRRKENQIFFGENACIVWDEANIGHEISVGDSISLIEDQVHV